MNQYQMYVKVSQQIKGLEEQKQELSKQILSELEATAQESVTNNFGLFRAAIRKTLVYSKTIQKMEEQLKIAKKVAEVQGKTTIGSQTAYLYFSQREQEVKYTPNAYPNKKAQRVVYLGQ